jgi:hypothetical protein
MLDKSSKGDFALSKLQAEGTHEALAQAKGRRYEKSLAIFYSS